jgi:hypothetical protein
MNINQFTILVGLLWISTGFPSVVNASMPSAQGVENNSSVVNQESNLNDLAAGSLAIQAIQGTPGALPIGNAEVEIDLVHQNSVIKTIHAQLDEFGIVVIDDFPVDINITPVIRISYAGVTYQEVGRIMGPMQPQQLVEVACYEVTNDIPDWSIPVRQVMISRTAKGIKITEIVVINNPSKKTWLGTGSPSEKPVTMSVILPTNAEQVQLGTGFHDWCCTSYDNNQLVNHLPLMPHMTELDFSYIIPVDNGKFDLNLPAPASVEQMIVMLPDDMHTHSSTGLALGGTRQIADTHVRYYTSVNLSKGDMVGMAISGITNVNAQVVGDKSKESGSENWIAFAVSGILLVAVVFILFVVKSRVSLS